MTRAHFVIVLKIQFHLEASLTKQNVTSPNAIRVRIRLNVISQMDTDEHFYSDLGKPVVKPLHLTPHRTFIMFGNTMEVGIGDHQPL